jgi:hypothetical protein
MCLGPDAMPGRRDGVRICARPAPNVAGKHEDDGDGDQQQQNKQVSGWREEFARVLSGGCSLLVARRLGRWRARPHGPLGSVGALSRD